MAAVDRLEPVGIESDDSAKLQQLVVSSCVDSSAYSSKIPSDNYTVSDNQLSSGVSSDDLTQYPFSSGDGPFNIHSPQIADSPKPSTALLPELSHVECIASESSNVGENVGEFVAAMVVIPGTKGTITKSLSCEKSDFSQGVSYTSQSDLCLAQSERDASDAMCSVQEPCYSIANPLSSTASSVKSALEADARSFTRSETPSSTGSSPPPLAMYSKRPNTVLEVVSGTPDTRLPPTSLSRDSLIVGFATTCTSVGIGFDDAMSSIGDTSLIRQNKPPLVASTPFTERSMDHHPLSGPQADEHLSDSGRASSSSVDLACRAGDLELMRIFYGGQEIADFISNEKNAECDALSLDDLALPGVMKIKTDQVTSAYVDQYNDSTDRSANSLTFYEDRNINAASDQRAVNATETPKSSVHSYSSEDKELKRQQCTSLSAVGSEESSTVLHSGSGRYLDVLSDSTGPDVVSGNSLRSEYGKSKVAYASGLTTHSLPPPRESNLSENGSEYDDDLGEDVRRILAKYRVSYLSKSGSDQEQNTASFADSSRPLVEVHPLTSESLVNMAVSEPSHSTEKEVDTASQTSNDTLARRVRGLLARDLSKNADGDVVITGNENCSYPLSSVSVSSASSSRTVSVDYGSLCKDLDDIQAGLENLRTSEKASLSSRHSSFSSVSSISGFNPKNVTAVHKFSYNDAVPAAVYAEFGVAAEGKGAVQMNESNENCVNPLLTSGILPIDVALDLLHGPVTTVTTNDISNSDGISFADTQMFFEKDVSADRQGIELRSHDSAWNNHMKLSRDATTRDVPCSLVGQALKDTSSAMLSDKANVVDKSLSSQNSVGLPASNSSGHLSGHEKFTLSTSVRPGHFATSGGEPVGDEAGRTSGLRPAIPRTVQSSCYLPVVSPSRQSDAGWSSVGRRDTSMVEDVLQDSHEPLPSLYPRPAGNSGAGTLSEHDSRYQADASLSEYSFSEQVQDAFERGSPPRQAYEYLREAEELRQALDFADRKADDASPCDDEFRILSQDVDMTGSFGLSPLPQHTPFDVMKTVRPLFMSQLDRISTADFNSSIGSSTKVSSVSPHQVDYNREQAGLAHGQLSTAKQYSKSVPTDTPFSTVSGSSDQTGLFKEASRFMPLTPLHADVSENSFVDAEDVSEAGGHTSNSSSRIALPVGDELFSHTVATSGGRSLRSDSPASLLLPYQPGGSHEIYYVDSSAEEMSVARSETTVESTHPGSDDAKAPIFPAHAYGSRAEAPVGATGIYSKRKSPLVSNELSAIEERTSSASDTKDGHGLASHSRHSLSSKSDSEKSRRMDKEQSVLKTKAWVSDINASHETTPQPDMTYFVGQRSSAVLTDPAAVQLPLSGLALSGLPTSRMPGSSQSDTVVMQQQAASRTGLSNEASHLVASLPNFHLKPDYGTSVPTTRSFAMRNLSFDDASEDSFSSGSRANETRIANKTSAVPQNFKTDDTDFCTPVKTADSLSAASRRHVNVGSENRSKVASALFPQTVTTESAAALPLEERQGTGFVADDRFGVRFESHYGLMPGVQTLIDRYVEKSQLPDSSSARSKQYSAPDSASILPTDQLSDAESTDRAGLRNAASEHIHTRNSPLESVLLIPPPAGFDESNTASSNVSGASHLQKLWERFTLTRPAETDNHDGNTPVVQPVRQPVSSRNLDMQRTAVSVRNSADETQRKETAGSNSRQDEKTQNSTERTHSSSQHAPNWSSSRGLSSANWHNSSSDSDQSPADWQDKNRTEHRVFREQREKTEAQKTQKATSSAKKTDSKRAWVIKEETLAPVPEDMTLDSVTSDFTSTSSVDNSGNIVTHTTKRHLPNDPRLLRLHQKIAIQREKHKKVQANERRRKERIAELERRLENEEALLRARNQRTAAGNAEEMNATLLASTDVTATTLTGATNMSSSLNTNDESDSTVHDPSNDTAQEDGLGSLMDRDASVCCACHRYASVNISPPITATTTTAAAVVSPIKRRAARSEVVISPKLQLQEVSYTRGRGAKPLHGYSSSNPHYEHRRATKSCHARTKVAASAAPSKKHDMFQYERENTAPRDWLDHRRGAKKLVVSRDGNGSLSVRHGDCRTRADVEREEPHVVSTAVQTTPRLHEASVGSDSALVHSDYTRTGRTAGQRTVISRAFQPESLSRTAQEVDQQMVIKKRPPTIQQRSLAWFVPFSGDETFNGPLKEIQQHLNIMQNSLSEWRSRGGKKDRVTSDSEVLDPENPNKEGDQPRVDDNEDSGLPRPCNGLVRQVLAVMPVSLQEAFDSNMAEFMSRSRERQRFVFLRAEERRLQDLEADERERLFGFNNQKISNTVADPAVDQLFHPRRRYFSKLEMKDLTKRNYGKLPEVARAIEMKQKIELVRSNWIRRKQYAQKVLRQLLSRSSQRHA